MDKMLEFIDAWIKSQKEFMEHWVKSQKEFMVHWLEATRKMQEDFLSMSAPREGAPKETKETYNLYNSWLTTMANSSKVFVEEAGKAQETWKKAVEKQMEMSREMVINYSELIKKGSGEKGRQ